MNRVCHSARVPAFLAPRRVRQRRENRSVLDVQDECDFSSGLSSYSANATRGSTERGSFRGRLWVKKLGFTTHCRHVFFESALGRKDGSESEQIVGENRIQIYVNPNPVHFSNAAAIWCVHSIHRGRRENQDGQSGLNSVPFRVPICRANKQFHTP
jgi:hypothetical protein